MLINWVRRSTYQAFRKKCRDGRYGSSVPELSIRAANHEAVRVSDRDTLRPLKLILLHLHHHYQLATTPCYALLSTPLLEHRAMPAFFVWLMGQSASFSRAPCITRDAHSATLRLSSMLGIACPVAFCSATTVIAGSCAMATGHKCWTDLVTRDGLT